MRPPEREEGRTPHHQGQPSTSNNIQAKPTQADPPQYNRCLRVYAQEAFADLGLINDGESVGL
jgi:hypothetical protein